MRILRPPTPPAPPAPAPSLTTAGAGAGALACRVRLADGRVFTGALPAARHRALQLGLLHADTAELVELTPGTRRADGRLDVDRRRHARALPARRRRRRAGLAARAARARRADRRRRLRHARGPANGPARRCSSASRRACAAAGSRDADRRARRWLWVDVDRPDRLDALWAFLAERPCQLLIASGGSGGVHAYWQLAEPLPARRARTRRRA